MSVSSACLPFLASSRLLKISLNFFNLLLYGLRIYIRVILFVCCVDLQCKCNIVHIPIGYFLYMCVAVVLRAGGPAGTLFATAETLAFWMRACPVLPGVQRGYSSNIVVTRCIPLLTKKKPLVDIYIIYMIYSYLYSICFDKKKWWLLYLKKKRVQKLYVQRLYYQEVQYLINCNSCNNLL